MPRFRAGLVFFLLAAVAPCQTGVGELLEQKTVAKLRRLDQTLDGVLGFAAIDLTTGRILDHHGDVLFPQASSIKVPLMAEVFRAARAGAFGLDDKVELRAAEAVGGSGKLQDALRNGPLRISARELLRAMIQDSDNTATNKLIAMTGMEQVNALMESFGFHATRLRRRMMDGEAAKRNEENVSTPREMVRLMETIYRNRVVDAAACREMLELMKLVKADIRKAVPATVEVAAKPGDVPGVRCETGIVFLPGRPFAVSIMTSFLGEEKSIVPEAAAIVYRHFEALARSNRYGHRVE